MKIGILGSGSWGTALAQVLCDNNHEVMIWGKNLDQVVDISIYHQNERFFPGLTLHSEIQATENLQDLKDADAYLLAVPSTAVRDVAEQIKPMVQSSTIVINVAKGLFPVTHQRLSEVIQEAVGEPVQFAFLTGPSHAEEVVLRKITSINAVSENEETAKFVQRLFSNDYLRVYRSSDLCGSEYASALKNVIAIGSGILDGLGQGDNARAALITRGLAEMTRFGVAMKADPLTFVGLTGLGDLIVTSTSIHSRNFRAGQLIGTTDSARTFWENNEETVEGIFAAKLIHELSFERQISMPICEAIYRVLYEDEKASQQMTDLMLRDLKKEDFY